MQDLQRVIVFSPDRQNLILASASLAATAGRVVRCHTEAEFQYCLQQIAELSAAVIDISAGPQHLTLLQEFARLFPAKPLIAIVGPADLNTAMLAIRCGASDYLLQPLLMEEIATALGRATLFNNDHALRMAQRRGWHRERDLGPAVGTSEPMRRTLQLAGELARNDNHLLIHGDTGAGKSYFARLIHFLSPRRFQPLLRFSPLNKTSGDALIELFGHQAGLLQPLHEATLVIEECHRLPAALQNRLAHVIEKHAAEQPAQGLRLIGLTSLTPESIPNHLFLRIGASQLHLPNLAQRQSDLPILCRSLLQQICIDLELPPCELGPEALLRLAAQPLPGNVHELHLILQRAAILSRDAEITISHLEQAGLEQLPPTATPGAESSSLQLEKAEELIIRKALLEHGGNISRTALALGISRGTLYNKMKRYRMPAAEFDPLLSLAGAKKG